MCSVCQIIQEVQRQKGYIPPNLISSLQAHRICQKAHAEAFLQTDKDNSNKKYCKYHENRLFRSTKLLILIAVQHTPKLPNVIWFGCSWKN